MKRPRFFSKRSHQKHSKITPKLKIIKTKSRISRITHKCKIDFFESLLQSESLLHPTLAKKKSLELSNPITLRQADLANLEVINQAWSKVILCRNVENPSVLYLIDQHAAHERIRFFYFLLKYSENQKFLDFRSIYLRFVVNQWKQSLFMSFGFPVCHQTEIFFFEVPFEGSGGSGRFEAHGCSCGHAEEEHEHQVAHEYPEGGPEAAIKLFLEGLKITDFHLTKVTSGDKQPSKNPESFPGGSKFKLIVYKRPLFFGKFDSLEIFKKSVKDPNLWWRDLHSLSHREAALRCKSEYLLPPHSLCEIFRERACKSGIKFNDKLTKKQACLILEDLKLCENPFSCIHGRNVIYPVRCGKDQKGGDQPSGDGELVGGEVHSRGERLGFSI